MVLIIVPQVLDQPLRHPAHRAAVRHQRLVAHRRRALIVLALTFAGKAPQLARLPLLVEAGRPAPSRGGTAAIGDLDSLAALPLFLAGTLYATAPRCSSSLSLLQAQWTYTGYDASAHVAEETEMARINSAWGIFLSVAVSAVVGYVMLMVLTWCIPRRRRGDGADPYPVLYIVSNNLTPLLTNVIAIVIGGAMWLCGLASVTSMGRMWYAFARDDGMPGSRCSNA